MKAKRVLCLALCALIALASSCALAAPGDYVGRNLRDFSAGLTDGSTFSLSEKLSRYDLVLIYFWATWCPPCRAEFPALQQAYEQYGDRVYVVALSVERNDTMSVITGYASQNGLTFPMGRDTSNIFYQVGGDTIPTTVLVTRDGTIAAADAGAKMTAREFGDLFERFLSR